MNTFKMNGYSWRIIRVKRNNPMLVDRTGRRTVATTDPSNLTVYISQDLYGDFYEKVLVHELGHCALFSFHLIDDIHRLVHPRYWVEAEEWVCNLIADYGKDIFESYYAIRG